MHRAPPSKLPPRQPAELSNSFIITTIQDLQPALINGVQQTPCEYAVQRARSIGAWGHTTTPAGTAALPASSGRVRVTQGCRVRLVEARCADGVHSVKVHCVDIMLKPANRQMLLLLG